MAEFESEDQPWWLIFICLLHHHLSPCPLPTQIFSHLRPSPLPSDVGRSHPQCPPMPPMKSHAHFHFPLLTAFNLNPTTAWQDTGRQRWQQWVATATEKVTPTHWGGPRGASRNTSHYICNGSFLPFPYWFHLATDPERQVTDLMTAGQVQWPPPPSPHRPSVPPTTPIYPHAPPPHAHSKEVRTTLAWRTPQQPAMTHPAMWTPLGRGSQHQHTTRQRDPRGASRTQWWVEPNNGHLKSTAASRRRGGWNPSLALSPTRHVGPQWRHVGSNDDA